VEGKVLEPFQKPKNNLRRSIYLVFVEQMKEEGKKLKRLDWRVVDCVTKVNLAVQISRRLSVPAMPSVTHTQIWKSINEVRWRSNGKGSKNARAGERY